MNDNEMEIEVIPQKPMDLDNKIKAEKLIKGYLNKPSIKKMFEDAFYRLIISGDATISDEELKAAMKAAENE